MVTTVIACDQNTDKAIVSTKMGQPYWDETSNTWRSIPLNKDADDEYTFYVYFELYGIPNGPSAWTNSM